LAPGAHNGAHLISRRKDRFYPTPMDRLQALLQLQVLEHMPRMGWLMRGISNPESVAAHSLGTAHVVLALGPGVDPVLDVDRAVSLAVLHDAAEARLGDLALPVQKLFPKGAKQAAEKQLMDALLPPLSDLAHARGLEALEHSTREARFVGLCDKLQMGLRLLVYVRAGARGLGEFRPGLEALDCSEFQGCDELRQQILTQLDAIG
jgi:putative hydrolase of HD superfamily